MKNSIIVTSLFYSGGTITEKDIFKTKNGFFALNDNYFFISNGEKTKVIKYELNNIYTFKLLKSKIKIMNKEHFIKFLNNDLFSVFTQKIFDYYLN